jgi:hypothetical protein
MRIRGFLWVALASAGLVTLAGCASAPGSSGSAGSARFPQPVATDEVVGQGTVLQKGDTRPELCLGAVAESYPPQCSGPPIVGWDWAAVDASESAAGVTWGSYAVTGTWNGTEFTVTQAAVPLALYDPLARFDPRLEPDNAGASDESSVRRLQDDVSAGRYPGVLSDWTENGYLWIAVIYDDGSVQDYFDDNWGAGVVAVQSALRAAD